MSAAEESKIEKVENKTSRKNVFLLTSLIVYFLGLFISKAATFIVLPFITKTIPTAEYGDFDLSQSIIMVIQPLFSLQIAEGIFRFLVKTPPGSEKQKRVVTSSTGVLFLGILFAAACFLVTDLWIYKLSNCWLMFANFVTYMLLIALQMLARSMGRNKDFAISGVINTFVMLGVQLLALLKLGWGVPGLFLGYILGELSGCLYLFLRLKVYKLIRPRWFSWAELKPMLRYSAPLVPNNISWWAASLACKAMLAGIVSLDAQGLYAVTAKFTSILVLFTEVFKLAWQESAVVNYENNDSDPAYNSRVLDEYIGLLFTGCSVAIPAIFLIFPYFIGANYQGALPYIPIAMFAACFSPITAFYGAGYNATKKTTGSLVTSLIGTGVNVLLCFLLIRFTPLGIFAIPISTLAGYLVVWVSRQISMRKIFPIKLNFLHFAVLAAEALGIVALFFFGGKIGNLIAFVLAFGFFLFANRRLVLLFIHRFFPKSRGKDWKQVLKESYRYLQRGRSFHVILLAVYLPISIFLYWMLVYAPTIRPAVGSEVLLVLLGVFTIPYLFSKKPSIADWCFLGYVGYSLATLVLLPRSGIPFIVGIMETAASILPAVLYFVGKQFYKKSKLFYDVFLGVCVFVFSIGIWYLLLTPSYYLTFLKQLLTGYFGVESWTYDPRMHSIISCTLVGIFASVATFVSASLFMKTKKKIYLVLMVYSIVGSVLSGQRAAILISGFAIVAFIVALLRRYRKARPYVIVATAILVVGAGLLIALNPGYRYKFTHFLSAFAERINDYLLPFRLGSQLLYGRGLGSLGHYALYYAHTDINITDCAFAKVLGETGIIGFGLFVSNFVFLVIDAKKAKAWKELYLPLGAVLAILLFSVGSNGFCYLNVAAIFYVSIGFARGQIDAKHPNAVRRSFKL